MPAIDNNDNVEEFDVDDSNQNVESDKDDETLDDTDTDNDVDTDDEDGSDDDSDDELGDSKEAKFEKRYSQLKGDTPEEYAKSLEDAYNNSSAEAVKLNREFKELKEKVGGLLAAADKDPELAKKLGLTEEDKKVDKPDEDKSPAEKWAEQRMAEEFLQDYKDFTKLHPEADTDETIRKELEEEVGIQATAYKSKTGKIIAMKDALSRAWKVLGYDDNSKEDLAVKLKENAGQGRSQGGSSKKNSSTKKPEVSEKALEMAKKFGLSDKDIQKHYKA